MIKGLHGLFYTESVEELRAFFRDKLAFEHVDAGDGWLIFGVPRAEFGVHPGAAPAHELSFWCDDLEATMAELSGRGVTFNGGISDQGFGLVTRIEAPGGLDILLYEPRHIQP